MKINKIKFSIKFFALCALSILLFVTMLFFNFRIKNNALAIQGGDVGGWFWSPKIGWASQNCSNRYYDGYMSRCGISATRILDVGFNGSDIELNQSVIKDISGNAIDGVYKDQSGNKLIRTWNIKNRTGDSSFDNSFYFDDKNSRIEFVDSRLLFDSQDKEFSISMWFKYSHEITSPEILFSSGVGNTGDMSYICYLNTDKKVRCAINNGSSLSYATSGEVSQGQWHNLTIVRDNITSPYDPPFGLLYLYLDYKDANSSVPFARSDNFYFRGNERDHPFVLGNGNYNSSNYREGFNGEIDEVRFFNSALTKEDILINKQYNSRYGIEIDDVSGAVSGFAWTNHYGWICFGESCNGYGNPPSGSLEDTKLYWTDSPLQGIFSNMIKGWAKILNLSNENSSIGWISLSGLDTAPSGGSYKNCFSCSTKDTEEGLISYFKMDEESGTAVSDYSGFGNNGNMVGFENNLNFATSDCKVGNCIYFDGDGYIGLPSSVSYNLGEEDFSLEMWVKSEQSQKYANLISSDKFELFVENDRGIIFNFLDKNSISYRFSLSDSSWHQIVVVVKNNDYMSLYVDGSLAVESKIKQYKDLILEKLKIGTNYKDQERFLGYVDTVRIYKNALSPDGVSYNYKYPEKKFCSSCFYYLDSEIEGENNICYSCEKCHYVNALNVCDSCSSCKKYGLVFDSNTSNIKGFAWGGESNSSGDGVGWVEFSPDFSGGIYRSYVSAQYGSIYSRANIGTEYSAIPPIGRYNASYLIQAKGSITNWISQQVETIAPSGGIIYDYSGNWMSQGANYAFPSSENNYGNILGSIDYNGLVNGNYGAIVSDLPPRSGAMGLCFQNGNVYMPIPQDGAVIIEPASEDSNNDAYRFYEDKCLNLNSPNSATIIIDGDLYINGNIYYVSSALQNLPSDKLASILWIVKGDLHIDKNVTKLAGTFVVLGQDKIDCGSSNNFTPHCGIIYTGDSNKQLVVSGQFLAKAFKFQRTFKSDYREPAELIIYDGRNLINTPAGMQDSLKSLPRWDQIVPY